MPSITQRNHLLSTRSLAEKLLLQEEEQRNSALSEEVIDQLTRIGDKLDKQYEVFKSSLSSLENARIKQEEEKETDDGFSSHPFQTGIKSITTASTAPTYPNFENLFNALGHSPDSGWIQNFGPGLLFVVFQRSPADESVNELRIEPYAVFPFAKTERGYAYNYMKLRADADGTLYQIFAV